MVRARFQNGSIGQPRDEAHDESHDRTDQSDEEAIRSYHQLDVIIGRAECAEHADRAQTALSQTVNPAIATRAIKSIAIVTSAIEMVSGFNTLLERTDAGVMTFEPSTLKRSSRCVKEHRDLRG